MGAVTIGVDLGQRRDPTAIAVAEDELRAVPERQRDETHFLIRFLERLPLGTSYPDVARRVAAVAAGVLDRTGARPRLYVDATGVGTPIVDMLREAEVPAQLIAVYFTHGDRRTEEVDEVKLGKGWLVARLQMLLQGGRLHLPQSSESAALARELLDYEIRVDDNANDRYGAFKVGTHDDLVTAVGLATQCDRPWRWIGSWADVPKAPPSIMARGTHFRPLSW